MKVSRHACARRTGVPGRAAGENNNFPAMFRGEPMSQSGGTGGEGLLRIDNVSVRFGGIVALDSVSFSIESGQIAGLIGPQRRRQNYSVQLPEPPLQRAAGEHRVRTASRCCATPRHRVAALGIGRTFQNVALFGSMSVLDNVLLGRHCRTRSGFFFPTPCACRWSGAKNATHRARAQELLRFSRTGKRRRHPCRRTCRFGTKKARRTRPRFGGRAQTAAARRNRASGLNHSEVDALGKLIRDVSRPAARDRAAGRTPHEPGDERVRQGGGAGLRPQDRRRLAR